jgi:hypothetical protein
MRLTKLFGLIVTISSALLLVLMLADTFVGLALVPQFPEYAFLKPSIQDIWLPFLFLGSLAVGIVMMRASTSETLQAQRLGLIVGGSFGIIYAILIFLPATALAVAWFPLLLLIPILGGGHLEMTALLFGIAVWLVPCICFGNSAFFIARKTYSIKRGIWCAIIGILATNLGAVLLYAILRLTVVPSVGTTDPFWNNNPLLVFLVNTQATALTIILPLAIISIVGLIAGLIGAYLAGRRKAPVTVTTV